MRTLLSRLAKLLVDGANGALGNRLRGATSDQVPGKRKGGRNERTAHQCCSQSAVKVPFNFHSQYFDLQQNGSLFAFHSLFLYCHVANDNQKIIFLLFLLWSLGDN